MGGCLPVEQEHGKIGDARILVRTRRAPTDTPIHPKPRAENHRCVAPTNRYTETPRTEMPTHQHLAGIDPSALLSFRLCAVFACRLHQRRLTCRVDCEYIILTEKEIRIVREFLLNPTWRVQMCCFRAGGALPFFLLRVPECAS